MKAFITVLLFIAASAYAKEPLFLMHEIDRKQTESILVMDFDGDRKLDVAAGGVWYHNPDWTPAKFMAPPPGASQLSTNDELVIDVNNDGKPDIIAGCWGGGGIWYYENPGKPGAMWQPVKITDTKNLEGLMAADVDGDGQMDILPAFWADQPYYWIQVKDGKFVKRTVGPTGILHGLGFADLNGDGKKDILTGSGWFEQIDLAADKWEYHNDWRGTPRLIEESSIPMFGYDVNADGLMDVIYGEAHDYGLYWLEQKMDGGTRAWIKHTIDPTYSQIHVLALADVNGDGKPELIAGKRYRAHGSGDAGAFDPIQINYYTIQTGKEPKFERFPLAMNSLAGVGTQCQIVDLDGDGDLDILFAGKSGQFWFENLLMNKVPIQKRDIVSDRFPTKL